MLSRTDRFYGKKVTPRGKSAVDIYDIQHIVGGIGGGVSYQFDSDNSADEWIDPFGRFAGLKERNFNLFELDKFNKVCK